MYAPETGIIKGRRTGWQSGGNGDTIMRSFHADFTAITPIVMTPPAHLIGSDHSVYYDLVAVDVIMCLCVAACSVWLFYQKRSARFIGLVWGGFLILLALGSLGLSVSIHSQRLQWRDSCARIAAAYADVIGKLNHWKIQPGNPEFFSEWSSPFILELDQQGTAFSQSYTPNKAEEPVHEKLATPKNLTAGWQDVPPHTDRPMHIQRRNQWAVAELTQDSKAFDRCTKTVFVQWNPVPNAATYRLQWGYFDGEETEWITAYTGSVPFCTLTIPDPPSSPLWLPVKGRVAPPTRKTFKDTLLALRVRAEDGTPEDDPGFMHIAEVLDFPVGANIFVSYVYTMRFVDDKSVQFIVSPISDANHNGFIDPQEEPNNIGELFPATPLTQYIRERKSRAMSFTPIIDRWGQWFCIAEPLWTPEGTLDGILAMDFNVNLVQQQMFSERIYPLYLLVFVTFSYLGTVLFINYLQIRARTISRLADELQDAVAKLTNAKKVSEQALQTKTLFLTNMSHEFRTPLNAMLGFTEILAQHTLKCTAEERRGLCAEAVKQMRESGKDLLELINNILGVAAMDGTQAPRLRFAPVHLYGLIIEVADMMRTRAEYKSLTLSVFESKSTPEWIQSDAAHIRQVLILLVDNAIKFTSEGSISIRYGVVPEQEASDPPMVYVSVDDTGIGIEPDYLKSLFKPFSQSDSSLTRKYGGAGIGLSVAKHSADILQGHISVESQPGQGSTFTFIFPGRTAEPTPLERSRIQSTIVLMESAPAQIESQQPPEVRQPLTGCRILYAEDTKVNQIVIAAQLTKFGAAVETADNGQIGIEKIEGAETRGVPFDVILMDMQMPVLDGYEATRYLRTKGYRKPIIAVTAHALPGDREKTLEAGCTEYVTKPVDFPRLVGMIKTFWSK